MVFLISSVSPVIIFLYLIYNKDHIKEPPALLAKCFFGGFLSILLTLVLNIPLEGIKPLFNGAFLKTFYDAFLSAALAEEFSKFIILYWIIWKSKEFDHHYDGIIYAVFVSLGFALVENLMYVYKGGLSVAVMRAILAVPGHGLDAVIMGYYFSLAKFHSGKEKTNLLVKSIFVPVLFHGLYDFLLMYGGNSNPSPLLILVLLISFTLLVIQTWRMGLRKIRKYHKHDYEVIYNNKEQENIS